MFLLQMMHCTFFHLYSPRGIGATTNQPLVSGMASRQRGVCAGVPHAHGDALPRPHTCTHTAVPACLRPPCPHIDIDFIAGVGALLSYEVPRWEFHSILLYYIIFYCVVVLLVVMVVVLLMMMVGVDMMT